MKTFKEFKELEKNLPVKKNGQYGRRALNMLDRAGYAYIELYSGSASALHDQGDYFRVCGFLNAGNDFAREDDVHKVVKVLIEHINERGDNIDSY
ncbi:MAG: hypothetical protein U5L98_17150 [Halomonas sp.]|uniref:hypothetical protein n=1 Tax=Halomonas sp. TaxID=1486246 RepID=UPI002ACEF61B|nr:hypothetical protein [Halomonas sp.]MDZ7854304.1 hypothetical protein [Halomonas sp.]